MILFLDVDGVLNCEHDWELQNAKHFGVLDPKKMDNLKKLWEHMPDDSSIVLSSTWRLHNDDDMAFLKAELKSRGMYIKDFTPNLDHLVNEGKLKFCTLRGTEIETWLFRNATDIDRGFIILDDIAEQFHGYQEKHLILTSFDDKDGGLNDEKTEEAIKLIQKLEKEQ